MASIVVGLIGFGTVGTGVVKILQENRDALRSRIGAELVLKWIADLDVESDRCVEVDPSVLTTDAEQVLEDPEVQIVVELIGGERPARDYILRAISAGKHVVTANKALLATHGNEIFKAASDHGVEICFEASVGGGIPIIRALKEGLAANRILALTGIVNGTSNYILTEMTEKGENFQAVLRRAQREGYAEADPTLDVEGIDAAHKLSILLSLAYGVRIRYSEIYVEGISSIEPLDIAFARELGYKIKLLAISKQRGSELEARVHPVMIPEGSPLANVNGVFNALHIEGDAVGETLFYGMGAGMMPTASAVVGDILELSRNLLRGVAQRVPPLARPWEELSDLRIMPMEEVVTNYYLRLMAVDRPGVLSAISGVLGRNDISIFSVVQKGRNRLGEGVPVVLMTHEAQEAAVQRAIREIDELSVTVGKTQLIRVEDPRIKDENL